MRHLKKNTVPAGELHVNFIDFMVYIKWYTKSKKFIRLTPLFWSIHKNLNPRKSISIYYCNLTIVMACNFLTTPFAMRGFEWGGKHVILHVSVIQCRVCKCLTTRDAFNPLPPTSHDRLRTRWEDIDKLLAYQALWELFLCPILSPFHF